jgi:hypothetical protein
VAEKWQSVRKMCDIVHVEVGAECWVECEIAVWYSWQHINKEQLSNYTTLLLGFTEDIAIKYCRSKFYIFDYHVLRIVKWLKNFVYNTHGSQMPAGTLK